MPCLLLSGFKAMHFAFPYTNPWKKNLECWYQAQLLSIERYCRWSQNLSSVTFTKSVNVLSPGFALPVVSIGKTTCSHYLYHTLCSLLSKPGCNPCITAAKNSLALALAPFTSIATDHHKWYLDWDLSENVLCRLSLDGRRGLYQ